MTPALTPVKFRKTTCDSHLVKRRNMAVFSLDLLIPTTCHSKKLKFRPPMEKPRPALRGGVAGRGARKRPPAFILLFFRPPGSPATFGCAEFTGWRTSVTHFGHSCACGERWLVTFRIAEGAHSGAQAVTLSARCHREARVPLRLADAQPPYPSAPVAVRRTGRGPVGLDGWCRAGCRCASDQPWW